MIITNRYIKTKKRNVKFNLNNKTLKNIYNIK